MKLSLLLALALGLTGISAGPSTNAGCDMDPEIALTSSQLEAAGNAGHATNIFMPPGCTCKQSHVVPSECVKFDCGCKCDLTAGMCDLNCCCDSECTADQKSKFKTCLDPGSSDPVYETCYSPYELSDINPKYPMRASDSAEAAYKNLLCVQTDNSGVSGIFFETGNAVTDLYPSSADAFKTPPDCVANFHYECYNKESLTRSSNEQNYVYGDAMRAITVPTPTTAVAAFGGSLPLPSPDANGFCSEHNSAKFGETVSDENR